MCSGHVQRKNYFYFRNTGASADAPVFHFHGKGNSLSQSLTALPAPSGREPLARPQTLRFSRKLYRHAKGPILEGAVERSETGGVQASTPSVLPLRVKPPSPRGRLNSPSRGYCRASPLWDGAFGMTVQFPAKAQSLRARQRLPLRGSWQNRQVLTEGVLHKKSTAHSQARICGALVQIIITSQYDSHWGCSSASSSCRRTSPRCRTQPPNPARSWPWWGRRSTRRYRRGGVPR